MAESGTLSHDYVLSRDYLSSVRLNIQHYLIVEELGYEIHPSIPIKPGMAIADVATGTGVWMISLASRMPNVMFHGFDIDLEQAPPRSWLPANVQVGELDIMKPVPKELYGKFDVVHVRLLILVIKNGPQSVIDNLMKLLKPGGYLQWVEFNTCRRHVEKIDPELPSTHLEQAIKFLADMSARDPRIRPTWVTRLASEFQASGLKVAADDAKYWSPSRLSFFANIQFMVYHELANKMSQEDRTTLLQLLDKAQIEVKNGVSDNCELRVVVGRKEE